MGRRAHKKRPVHDFQRVDKQILTREDWYPTVDGRLKVSFMLLTDQQWRVCVWGGDDFGMDRDFPHTERQAAKELFESLKDFTTQKQMQDLGMTRV